MDEWEVVNKLANLVINRYNRQRQSRGVAQPGSALAWGARGREFESHRPDHLLVTSALFPILLDHALTFRKSLCYYIAGMVQQI